MGTHEKRKRRIVIAVSIGIVLMVVCSAILFVRSHISAEPGKQNYIEYNDNVYQFDHNVGIKYLAYDKVTNSIYASVPTEGKVYRFSPEQVE